MTTVRDKTCLVLQHPAALAAYATSYVHPAGGLCLAVCRLSNLFMVNQNMACSAIEVRNQNFQRSV